ncbi:hypothetical protein [Bergeyella zoohelcum]|uniref:C-type lysozyme inhibitor domain-containing protein n=1 Tax=Bergeyella zoohelcum TaxID=1015 RepID=A0A376C0T4_9FLAO|nr:hypothetical protein [Bergeyella zoohelcum]EKB57626.1 hypothetical protein HMPREF9700_02151 [Bergeyella zoohelcum CCUG 30536]SSZ55710.1 Uncharacterised protein [Bergeyella zoohelcum]
MKNTFLIATFALVGMVACNKNENTVEEKTQITQESNAVENNDAYLSEEAAIPEAPGDIVEVDFISEDGKTKLIAEFDAINDIVTLENEMTNEEMRMKRVISASGEVYKDDKGNSFTVHQGKFYLEKNGQQVLTGTEVK